MLPVQFFPVNPRYRYGAVGGSFSVSPVKVIAALHYYHTLNKLPPRIPVMVHQSTQNYYLRGVCMPTNHGLPHNFSE